MKTLLYERLTEKLRGHGAAKRLFQRIQGNSFPVDVHGPKDSFFAYLVARIFERHSAPLIVVVPTEQEANSLYEDLYRFGTEALHLPWWGTVAYSEVPGSSPVHGRRMRALNEIAGGSRRVVIVPLRSAISPLPPRDEILSRRIALEKGGSFDPVELARKLNEFGYSRVPQVSVRGEYALRGEVLDLYIPGFENPLRVVFEFDEIERVTFFDVSTQSSIENVSSVVVYPVKEVLWSDRRLEVFERAVAEAPELRRHGDEFLEELRERRSLPGEEYLYSLAFEEPESLMRFAGSEALFVFSDYERLLAGTGAIRKEFEGVFADRHFREPLPKPARILSEVSTLEQQAAKAVRFHLLGEHRDESDCRFAYDPPRSFFGNLDFLKEELTNLLSTGYEVLIYGDTEAQANRITHMLAEYDVTVVPESISTGFALPDVKLIVIEENEIFGRRKRVPHSVKRAQSSAIETFVELSPGDHVVHVNYGIGLFKGIKRIQAAGNERDYIHLEYAGGEFIYIPIEQVNLIQRFIGHGGQTPKLDKIGGKSWENRKNNVRKNVEDLAERLIKLYSRRKKARGFAFPADTEWQYDFESKFPYEETDDQLRCIAEVKSDMERPLPMDRLVCGDVGYGKTEIAMRAAFKAVASGKQVAILAPTTILVEQHFENFNERLEGFPVVTGMLSRFVSRGEARKIRQGLAEGSVDLVVGTHRLLQKDVKFKDLGLIVIDEEQRFGVKAKEKLKELKTSVDSLTLTATPIPRTLHMSLLKIRDMSVLRTPPHNRLPIETVIQEFSEELIQSAIRRELERGGQVYFLHNRVETLDNIMEFVQTIVPEAIVESAHGQMESQELEDIMHRFIHGGFHVLVATTIIENGIDIPNVNTIIIDRADMYGISQLYQLRGRVGRSDRLAYAYLLYPEQRALSEIAMKRLQVISDYTELGSGFKIALKDLEVRGAGNLLGREQSGDIMSVGFDLYLKLLDEAIRDLEGDGSAGEEEVYLELEYTGFVPDSYVSEPAEKMEVYKKIASISTEDELGAIYSELEDRFGPLPEEVQSLLSLAEIRIICRRLHIASIKERRGVCHVEFGKVAGVSVDKVLSLIEQGGGKVQLDSKNPNVLKLETGSVGLKEKSEFIRGRLSQLL
ncbi:MAG: transcription-repair coupling factor [Alkalispirochaetaceae bacterium]